MHEIGVQRCRIVIGHQRIGRVWHCRIQTLPVCTLALAQRVGELCKCIVADAVGFRRSDIRRNNGTQGRWK